MTDELKAAVERASLHAGEETHTPFPDSSYASVFIRALADEPEVVMALKPDETRHPFDITRDILQRLAEIVK